MDQTFSKAQSLGLSTLSFFKFFVGNFFSQDAQKNAAALTYMSLFAMVPMMTVIYSMFSVIPAFHGVADQLNALIFDNFVPETGDQVKSYLADFSSQARNLTGVGVLMLLVTAFLMLKNIEKTFNTIWGVKQARRGLSSFLLYWAVLSIGPLMIGAGLVVSTYLLSLKMVVQEYDQIGVLPQLFRLIPLALATLTFTLLFAAVPNCKVPLKNAAIGGFVTAICLEMLKLGFSALVANSSVKLIYGAFAVVPLFLMWVNLLWIVVLGGAVFVRTLTERDYVIGNRPLPDIRALLLCLSRFREKSQTGALISDRDCVEAGVNIVQWHRLRSILIQAKWMTVSDTGRYALCRDLRSVSLWDLASLVKMPVDEPVFLVAESASQGWVGEYMQRREQVENNAREAFDISLEALFAYENSTSKAEEAA
jgi:membrane protein